MGIDIHYIFIGLGVIVIASALFNKLSAKTKIPAVLFLIALGVLFQLLFASSTERYSDELSYLLQLVGTLGLILIVFEGSLDLLISREKIPLIRKAFLIALIGTFVTTSLITAVFMTYLNAPLQSAFVYALPLSIISSAIAIPTAIHLRPDKREFITYESTFSDIIGIIIFTYAISDDFSILNIVGRASVDLLVTIPAVLIFLGAVILLANSKATELRFMPILAILVGVYGLAKTMGLPALLFVLTTGLLLKNTQQLPEAIKRVTSKTRLTSTAKDLAKFVRESSFFIRTFFFILFGYTLPLDSFMNEKIIYVGLAVISIIMVVRLISLKVLLNIDFMQELLIAPRGLITIILFFSIPENLQFSDFDEGIIYFAVIASTLIAAGAYIFSGDKAIKPKI